MCGQGKYCRISATKAAAKIGQQNRIRTLPYERNNAIDSTKPERVLLRPPRRGEKTEKIFTTDDRCIKRLFNTTIYLAKGQTKRGSATLYIYTSKPNPKKTSAKSKKT